MSSCNKEENLRIDDKDLFSQTFPNQSKDLALHLMNTYRINQWMTKSLIPVLNQIGKKLNIEDAKNIEPPILCMQNRYKKVSREKVLKTDLDSVWAGQNMEKILQKIEKITAEKQKAIRNGNQRLENESNMISLPEKINKLS